MKRIPRPRLWVRLASVVALGFGLWLLLTPRIVLYGFDDEGQPHEIDVKYAWGQGTSDQILIMSADMFDESDSATGELVSSVRLNCGLVFTSGENEADAPGGAAACSEIETPRLISGIGLALLGITGLGVAGLLPPSRNGEHVRGADDLFRVDDIPALDHPVLGENPEDKP